MRATSAARRRTSAGPERGLWLVTASRRCSAACRAAVAWAAWCCAARKSATALVSIARLTARLPAYTGAGLRFYLNSRVDGVQHYEGNQLGKSGPDEVVVAVFEPGNQQAARAGWHP